MATINGTFTLDTKSQELTLTANGKKLLCLPYSQYHTEGETHLSHGVSIHVKGDKLTGFSAPREVDPESTSEPQNRAPSKAVLAKLRSQLQAVQGKPAAYLQLDVRNRVDVPMNPRERMAIFDALPVELREAFTHACQAADSRGPRK